MKSKLLFDFIVKKENKTIHVTREFNANLKLVWKAWTTSELLDQWWAPAPFRNQTKVMDFREGGHWHYSMISPENHIHWSRFDYKKIDMERRFTGLDAFCDESGNINTGFSRMHWDNVFNETTERTIVNITISVDTLESLEQIVKMGFKEGFTMGLDQLDKLLITLKSE